MCASPRFIFPACITGFCPPVFWTCNLADYDRGVLPCLTLNTEAVSQRMSGLQEVVNNSRWFIRADVGSYHALEVTARLR